MNETARQVIDTIVENRKRFEAFCYSLTPEQLDRPVPESTWVVRDFIAHLGTLDPPLEHIFTSGSAAAPGDATVDAQGRAWDVDAYNDAQVAERRSWPIEKVFAEAAEHRAKFIEMLSGMSDEQVNATMHFGGDAKRPPADIPLNLFMVGWAQHDPIHVADMLKALPERADDPELRAWLDHPHVGGYQQMMNR